MSNQQTPTHLGSPSRQRTRRQFILPPCPCACHRHAHGRLKASVCHSRESGFALVWWALVISFAAFPLLVFVVEGARYLQAAGAVQKAADAAAEAAVREIDVAHYIATGEIAFGGAEYSIAALYANANAQFLHTRQIGIEIVSIGVDEAAETVQVTARADVSALFPAIAPSIAIQRTGTAQVRLTAR